MQVIKENILDAMPLDPMVALTYEMAVYNVAGHLTHGVYSGGTWELVKPDTGGFFMRYAGREEKFPVHNAATYYDGELSAEAFSLAVNLYVSNALFFKFQGKHNEAMETLAKNYHYLREYFLQDESPFSSDEISAILSATD